jgi:hypothetical protein
MEDKDKQIVFSRIVACIGFCEVVFMFGVSFLILGLANSGGIQNVSQLWEVIAIASMFAGVSLFGFIGVLLKKWWGYVLVFVILGIIVLKFFLGEVQIANVYI